MNLSVYQKRVDEIVVSDLMCRCCGSKLYVLSNPKESICNFCESYVTMEDKNTIHGSIDVEQKLFKMQECVSQGRWQEGTVVADALAATKDPHFMFGAAAYYKFFSDYVYNDVNYSLPGFMYSNSEKRSDELQKNKYNAMALISKSKEYLFKTLKVIKGYPNSDDSLSFLCFMADFKLKRYPQARNLLATLGAPSVKDVIRDYSNMVFNVHIGSKAAETCISASFGQGIVNSFYYLARHLAAKKQNEKAITLLSKLITKTNMNAAIYYKNTLSEIVDASRL